MVSIMLLAPVFSLLNTAGFFYFKAVIVEIQTSHITIERSVTEFYALPGSSSRMSGQRQPLDPDPVRQGAARFLFAANHSQKMLHLVPEKMVAFKVGGDGAFLPNAVLNCP
jgi:hypothetical protein